MGALFFFVYGTENASKEDGAEKAGKSAKTAGKRKFELTKAINTRHFLVNVFQHMSSIKVDRGKWRHSKVDDKYEHLHGFHPSYWNPLNPVVYVQTIPEEKLETTAGLMWSDIMKQKIASPESICSTVPALTRFMDDLNMGNVDESMDEVLPFLLNEKYQCHDGHVRLPLNYCAQICVNNQTSFFDDWSHTPRGVFVFTEKHDEVNDNDEFMTDDEDEREIESLVKRGVSRVNAKKFVEKRREYKSDDRYRALIRKQTMAPNDTTMDVDSMNVSTASLKELTEMEESYFMSPHSNPANRYGMAEIRSRMIHEIRKPIAGGWGSRTLKLPYVAGMSLLSSLVAVLDHGLLVHCRCISPEHYWLMAMLSNPIKPTPLHFVGPSGSGKSRIVEVLINTLKMSWCELRVSASNDTLDLKSGGIHCCIMYDDTNMFKGRANVMLEEGESTHERTKMGDKKERIEQILNVIRNVAVFTNLLNAVINGDTPYNGTTLKRFVNFSVLEIKVPFSLSFRVDKASIEARNMFCEEVRNVVVAGSNVQRMVSCGMREVTDVLDLILAAVQNDSAIFDDKRRLGCARKLARVLAAHEFAYGTSAARTGGNTVHAWSPKSIARETVIVTAEAAIMGIALVAGDDYWSERMCMHALLQYVLKVKSKWFFGADEWLPSTVPREVVPGSEDGSLTFGLSERTMQLARMRNEESSSSKKKKKKKTQETKKDITDQNRMRGKMEAIPESDDEREDKKDDGADAADGAVDPNSTSGDNQVETYKQLIDMYDEMQARNPTMFAKRERFELPIRLSACHDPIKALVNSILSKVAFAEASILRDAFTVHLKSKSGPNGKIRIVGHVMFVPFWMFGYERPKKHRRVYTRLAACLRPDRIYVLPHSGRDGPDFTENLDPRLPATFCPRTELESLKRRNQKAYVRLVKKNQDLERSVDKHVRGDVSESTANEILSACFCLQACLSVIVSFFFKFRI